MLSWLLKKVRIRHLFLIKIDLVWIGGLNEAEIMEGSIKGMTESSEPPSNIVDMSTSANSPDDYYDYTNSSGHKSRRFTDTPDDFLTEAEENV